MSESTTQSVDQSCTMSKDCGVSGDPDVADNTSNSEQTADKQKQTESIETQITPFEEPIAYQIPSEVNQTAEHQSSNNSELTTDKSKQIESDETQKILLIEPIANQTQPEVIQTAGLQSSNNLTTDKSKQTESVETQNTPLDVPIANPTQPEVIQTAVLQSRNNLTTDKTKQTESNETQKTPLENPIANQTQPEVNQTAGLESSNNPEPITDKSKQIDSIEIQMTQEPIANITQVELDQAMTDNKDIQSTIDAPLKIAHTQSNANQIQIELGEVKEHQCNKNSEQKTAGDECDNTEKTFVKVSKNETLLDTNSGEPMRTDQLQDSEPSVDANVTTNDSVKQSIKTTHPKAINSANVANVEAQADQDQSSSFSGTKSIDLDTSMDKETTKASDVKAQAAQYQASVISATPSDDSGKMAGPDGSRHTTVKALVTPGISTQSEIDLAQALTDNNAANVRNRFIKPYFQKVEVNKKHIYQVMEALGFTLILKKALYQKLCNKYCTQRSEEPIMPWSGGPIEEIREDDDRRSCKILHIRVPKHWKQGHIMVLLIIKTNFNVNQQFVKMFPLKIDDNYYPFQDYLLRFLTHQECLKVMVKLRKVKLYFKPMFAKLDIRYAKAKLTKMFGPMAELNIKLQTSQIDLYEYNKLKTEMQWQPYLQYTQQNKSANSGEEIKESLNSSCNSENFGNEEKSDICNQSQEADMAINKSNYSDVSGERTLKKEGEESKIDESDEDHCRIIQISNIPKKAVFTVVKNLIRNHTNLGYEATQIRVTPNGVALLQCPSHELAARVVRDLNGFIIDGHILELKLDIGHTATRSLLPNHRQFVLKGTKRPMLDTEDSALDEQVPTKKWKEDPEIDLSEMPPVHLPPREYSAENYGLSPHFLKSLKIRPPFTEIVTVHHLHPALDVAKLTEIFSFAGNIKHLKIEKNVARIVYDHPVEAVQAISMFNGQKVYNKEIFVKMDFSKSRPLPLGVQSVGPGLGEKGAPLYGVRSHIEIKQIKQLLAKRGQVREVPLATQPFSVAYVNSAPNKPFPNINQPPPPFPQSGFDNSPNSNDRPNTPNANAATANTSNQNIPQNSNQVDSSVVALSDILAQHGLIEKNSKCQDVGSILNALRNNKAKEQSSSNNDAQTGKKIAVVTKPHPGPKPIKHLNTYINRPPNNPGTTNIQYNQPNVAPNFNVQSGAHVVPHDPYLGINNPGMTFNTPNFAPNEPNVTPYAPTMDPNLTPTTNTWQSNVSQTTIRWDQPPPMIPPVANTMPPVHFPQYDMSASIQHVPLPVQNVPLPVHNVPLNVPLPVQNVPLPVQNVPLPVQNVPHPVQNMPLPVQNMPLPVQNVPPPPVQNTQNFSHTMHQGDQNYTQNMQQQIQQQMKQLQQQYHEFQQQQPQQNLQNQQQQKFEAPSKRKDHDRNDDPRIKKQKEPEESKSSLLMFDNLPPSVTADALNSKMREVGAVVFGELTGQGRAIVRFRHAEDAARCVKLFHRSKVDSQIIEVSYV